MPAIVLPMQTTTPQNKPADGTQSAEKYIVTEHRKDLNRTYYVCAPPGFMRKSDGTQARDGSFSGGPEWTLYREKALEFTSFITAARVAGKCASAKVRAA